MAEATPSLGEPRPPKPAAIVREILSVDNIVINAGGGGGKLVRNEALDEYTPHQIKDKTKITIQKNGTTTESNLPDFLRENLVGIAKDLLTDSEKKMLITNGETLTAEQKLAVYKTLVTKAGDPQYGKIIKRHGAVEGVNHITPELFVAAVQTAAIDEARPLLHPTESKIVHTPTDKRRRKVYTIMRHGRGDALGLTGDDMETVGKNGKHIEIPATVREDLMAAQQIFNSMIPTENLIEIVKLENQLRNATTPQEKDALSHTIVETRQKYYRAILCAYDVRPEKNPLTYTNEDKALAEKVKARAKEQLTYTDFQGENWTSERGALNAVDANRITTAELLSALDVPAATVDKLKDKSTWDYLQMTKHAQHAQAIKDTALLATTLGIDKNLPNYELARQVLSERINTDLRLAGLANTPGSRFQKLTKGDLAENLELVVFRSMGLKGIEFLYRRSQSVPEEKKIKPTPTPEDPKIKLMDHVQEKPADADTSTTPPIKPPTATTPAPTEPTHKPTPEAGSSPSDVKDEGLDLVEVTDEGRDILPKSGSYSEGWYLSPEKRKFYRDRLSPRLKEDPTIKLDPNIEIPEYFKNQTPEYMQELEGYLEQPGMQQPMDPNCDAIICMPVYDLGEGEIINHTLEQYLLQIDKTRNQQALDPSKFEIILFLNHPKKPTPENPRIGREFLEGELGHSYLEGAEQRVRDGKPEKYDTEEVIKQFMAKHPELRIRYMKKEFETRPRWGDIIKPIYDLALLRAQKRAEPFRRDPTIITNDADLVAMSPTYVRDILQRMDINEIQAWRDPKAKKIDALIGNTDMTKDLYANAPGFLLAMRFYQYLEAQNRGNRSTQGRNTSFRGSSYAALGGVNNGTDDGADGEFRLMINLARQDDPHTIPYTHKAWLITDPRREFDSWKKGRPLIDNWADWGKMDVYDKSRQERFPAIEDATQINKTALEYEITMVGNRWYGGVNNVAMKKALGFIGLRNHQEIIDLALWYGLDAKSPGMEKLLSGLGLQTGDYHIEKQPRQDGTKKDRVIIDKKEGHMDYHIEYDTNDQGRTRERIVIDDLTHVKEQLQEYIKDERWKTTEGKIESALAHPPIAILDNKYYVEYMNYEEFDGIYGEIFVSNDYPWKPNPENPKPKVIDLGGHIGMSTLYWKSVAPGAEITVVEANPQTAKVLQRNVDRNHLTDVRVIHGAASARDEDVELYQPKPGVDFRWGDFIGGRTVDNTKYETVRVPSVKLSTLIDEPVDVLKIDIEGAETEVLREAEGKLGNVNEIFMEFHNNPSNPTNSLAEIRAILARQGFNDIQFTDKGHVISPATLDITKEFLLNITARRGVQLEEMNSQSRAEVIEDSARLCETLPHAVLMGGVALRTLYEAKMGKPMFEHSKGDYDIYLPNEDLLRIDQQAPEGYRVDQNPLVHKPSEGYIVLRDEKDNMIDVFGQDQDRQYEDIVLDGKTIRVLSLGEQIADKLTMYISDFGRVHPKVREKHRLYARKLLELADTVGNEQEITLAWERMQKRNAENAAYAPEWKTLLTWLVDIGWKE